MPLLIYMFPSISSTFSFAVYLLKKQTVLSCRFSPCLVLLMPSLLSFTRFLLSSVIFYKLVAGSRGLIRFKSFFVCLCFPLAGLNFVFLKCFYCLSRCLFLGLLVRNPNYARAPWACAVLSWIVKGEKDLVCPQTPEFKLRCIFSITVRQDVRIGCGGSVSDGPGTVTLCSSRFSLAWALRLCEL